MQIGDGKNQVGNGGGVAHPLDFHLAGDGIDIHFPVQIPGFDPEIMGGEFPYIKTDSDNHRQLGMHTGKIPGNNSVKGAYNGKFAAVFLGKIAKGKQFYLHIILPYQVQQAIPE
jgi:hypothetical protein